MSAFKTKHEQHTQHRTSWLTVPVQMGLVLAMLGVLLYTVFFSTYPPVHDFFHEFRHSMMIIPCH